MRNEEGDTSHARVYLALGSNVGGREAYLNQALQALDVREGITLQRCSSFYETDPVGELNQPAFLNAAAEIETALGPLELLNVAKFIERHLGRKARQRWGPREIDIDIVLWADRTFESPELTLPHSRFRERAFVLAPLAEIAPGAVDPVTGQTVETLAGAVAPAGHIRRLHSTTP